MSLPHVAPPRAKGPLHLTVEATADHGSWRLVLAGNTYPVRDYHPISQWPRSQTDSAWVQNSDVHKADDPSFHALLQELGTFLGRIYHTRSIPESFPAELKKMLG